MKLPTWRQLPYISPSTFMKWDMNCQYRVYLTRLAGFPYMREPQGIAAAIGSAVDAFLKDYIAKKRGEQSLALELDHLLESNIDKKNREDAIPKGLEIAKAYIELGFAEEFLQLDREVKLDIELYKIFNYTPILGQLDMIVDGIPFDWKTSGFGATPKYATKGYNSRIDYNIKTGEKKIKDPKPEDIEYPLEEKNIRWAVQLCFYSWLLSSAELKTRQYIIHEMCHHNGTISFCVHKGIISEEFSINLLEKVRNCWSDLYDDMYYARIEEPQPTKRICEAWGKVCEAAHLCKYYENTLGCEDKRDLYV